MVLKAAPDLALFVNDLRDFQAFCALLFERTFTSFFKDKSQKEVSKQLKSRFFKICLLDVVRIRNWIHI
jgi:hypothetical protein